MTSSNISGISSIEIVPSFTSSSIVKRLQSAISSCDSLRAAVAYWTIPAEKISKDLAVKLAGSGFLCVDINYPTDIDELDQLAKNGANIFLHLLRPNPQPGELKTKMPPHLMHAKTLLFDLKDDTAEFWIGSHNWTARALSGLNIEASNVIGMNSSCNFYSDAQTLLESIKASCIPFDRAQLDYYKWLQGQQLEDVEWIIDLKSTSAEPLSAKRITIFLISQDDFRSLKKVDKIVKLSVQDTRTGSVYLYSASIVDTGHIARSGLDYDDRLHAFQSGSTTPTIDGPSAPPSTRVKSSKFWATVEVGTESPEELPNYPNMDFFNLTAENRWIIAEKNDVFESRVSPEDRSLFKKSKKVLIQRPVTLDAFLGKGYDQFELDHLKSKELEIKPLIRKGIIYKGEKENL